MKKLFFLSLLLAPSLLANYDSTLKKLSNYIDSLIAGKYNGYVISAQPQKITTINEIGVIPKDPLLLSLNDRTRNELSTDRMIRPILLVARPGFQQVKKDFLTDVSNFIRLVLKPEKEVETYSMSFTKRTFKPESRVVARMQAIDGGEPIDLYYKLTQYSY